MLKPADEPSMGARHDAAIAKEKRLEQQARPATAAKHAQKRERESNETQGKKATKKQMNKKQKVEPSKGNLANKVVLEEDDEVAEGINWSDEESSSDGGEAD